MTVRVWSPAARTVDLHLPATGEVSAMVQLPGGWWRGPALPHGTDYWFAIDGGDPRPDPRSPWQPDGVHGPSRVFDTGLHRWSDAAWAGRDVRGAVVYELHVGTFTTSGTLDGAIDRLDHLVELGVDMVELMPVAAFPGAHGWGYDGVALFAVHEPYGGPAALQRFVDAAHVRGIAVCLDVVYNHLGPSGNYLAAFGPYFTDRHTTPWGQGINLDGPGAREVRAWVVDNAVRWFGEFHLDALRLDAVHALADDSPHHVLADLSDAVAALSDHLGRPLSLVAESDLNDVATVTPTSQGGLGMTAQWADDVHHALHTLLTGETHGYYADFGSPKALAHAMTRVFVHDGGWSAFRGRPWGRPVPPSTDGHRFVVFGSDHDQVGNRALGDRPSQRLDDARLAAGAALVLTSPFTPMLFMGEEWGATTPFQFFTDHEDVDLADAIREGRTEEFSGHGWVELYGTDVEVPDPQSATTVEASRLDWTEPLEPRGARLLAWYRTLISLRRSDPDIADGDLRRTSVRLDDQDAWLVVSRGDVRVVVCLTDVPTVVEVTSPAGADAHLVAAWDAELDAQRRDGGPTVRFSGAGVAVVHLAPAPSVRPTAPQQEER
ncbi:MAG: malto-oligosyltrehalose trehalohydrolase [Cellulomonadaceae bacterium]|nr:malto-oligosyltrehalose trehalohydrolase [Cellulomonadaceae bacterium]